MNLSNLTDLELEASAIVAAGNERAALHVVLEHLAEVQKRKSFSPDHKSIHEYAMKKMGYDDKSAWRRVNAMFLLLQLPEIKTSIQNGELDLTKLVIVQNHFRIENQGAQAQEPSLFGEEPPKAKLSKDEKLEVIQSVIGKSSRETIRTLAQQSSAPQKLKRPDQIKPLENGLNELRSFLSDEDLEVLRDIKELTAHKNPNATHGELLSLALKEARESLQNKKAGKVRRAASEYTSSETTRTPTLSLQQYVYQKAEGKCEICGSKHATEYDHKIPWAQGGKTNAENIRLLCRNCNQREAIKIVGTLLHSPELRYG